MPSLQLELQPSGTTVLFRVPPDYVEDLHKLAVRFLTARHLEPALVELELEDLLANLRELRAWPSPQDVEWQPELKTLVEGNHRDSLAARSRLGGSEAPTLSDREI